MPRQATRREGGPNRQRAPGEGKTRLCKSIGKGVTNPTRCTKSPKREEVLSIASISHLNICKMITCVREGSTWAMATDWETHLRLRRHP